MTIRVGRGSVTPSPENRFAKIGTTHSSSSADDQSCDADDRDGINQRRFHSSSQTHSLLHVGGQALKNDVQNTASFTRFNHVGGEVVEDGGILPHRIGQRGTTFHRSAHASQRLLERLALLIGRQNFQTLHQGQASVDHDRKLAEEDRDVLDLDLTGSEGGHRKFFALFANCARSNVFASQLLSQRLFVGRGPFPGNFLSGSILAGKCKNWHVNLSSNWSSLTAETFTA